MFFGVYGKEGFYTGDKGKTIKRYSQKEINKAFSKGSKLQRVSDPGRFYDLKKGKGTLKAGYKLGEVSEGTRKALGIQQYNVVKGSTGFTYRPARYSGAGHGRTQTRRSGYNEGTSTFAVWKDPNYKPPAPKPAKPARVPKPVRADYKPIPVTKPGKVTPAVKPEYKYNVTNDPAYKALQKRLTTMQNDYKSQFTGLTGQISGLTGDIFGLTGKLNTARDAYRREQELRAASDARMQEIARQQAYNQATNPQAGGVKVKRSDAYEGGLTSRGSTGYFNRSGLRISNLNL